MTSELPVRIALAQAVEGGADGTGGQLFVSPRGKAPVSEAIGDTSAGDAMSNSTLHPAYCALKPVLALALGHLVDEGLELDRPCRELAPTGRVARALPSWVTCDTLLSHDAGLKHPSAASWRLERPEGRDALMDGIARQPQVPAYSEIAGWIVVEELIESWAGVSAHEYIEDQVLRPVGIENDVIVSAGRALEPSIKARLRVPIGGLPHDPIPLLSEQLDSQLHEIRPAFSGLASAEGLGRLLCAVAAAWGAEERVAGMPTFGALQRMLKAASGRRYDATLGRVSSFAGGWWKDLDGMVGPWNRDESLVTMAGVIEMVAAVDLSSGDVVSWVLNGVKSGVEGDGVAVRRLITSCASRLLGDM